MNERPKVLFVASEVSPFRTTGGLADVAGALPKWLARRGIDVRVVMPLYRGIAWDELDRVGGVLEVPMFFGTAYAAVRSGTLPGTDVPIYFLEHHHYYDRWSVYDHHDNLERFVFLSRGALELTRMLDWVPEVVHANDWHTGLVPIYLNTVEWGRPLHGAASVFTIHNLAHQGDHGADAHPVTGLGPEHFNAGEFEHFGQFNPLKAALWHATMLSTVSPTYAREIQGGAFGCGLDGILAARSGDLRGILNGIDTLEWDPTRDRYLPAHFDRADLSGKAVCKAALQAEMGLPVRADVPLFGVVSRLAAQKGLDVLAAALGRVLDLDLQLAVLGTGDRDTERAFETMAAHRPDRLRCFIGFDTPRAHRIEAGCDFLVIPSRFEPCGLNQMYSHRYGTLPVVRATGGLADTVDNYDEASGTGTGFVFHDLTVEALADTIAWAVSTFRDRPGHLAAMRWRALGNDWSWERAAAEYEQLYRDAYARRRGHQPPWQ
jgi:starch synthase